MSVFHLYRSFYTSLKQKNCNAGQAQLKGALLSSFAASKLLQRSQGEVWKPSVSLLPQRDHPAMCVNKCMFLKVFVYEFAFAIAV